jgi:hypothetical protein
VKKAFFAKLRLPRLRGHRVLRYVGLSFAIAIAMLAAAIVSSLTIDLGPAARGYAEREASTRLERPVHIGRLSIHLLRGRVALEDMAIEGRRPEDRAFFTAK